MPDGRDQCQPLGEKRQVRQPGICRVLGDERGIDTPIEDSGDQCIATFDDLDSRIPCSILFTIQGDETSLAFRS